MINLMINTIAFYSYLFVGVLFYIIAAYLIAEKIGRKRPIGFTNSFIVNLINPLIGLLLALSSRRRNRSIFSEKELKE